MNTLKLLHVVRDSDGDEFSLKLEMFEREFPLLSVWMDFYDLRAFKAVAVTPEYLESLAGILSDWAERLRTHQSEILTNNLFEEES